MIVIASSIYYGGLLLMAAAVAEAASAGVVPSPVTASSELLVIRHGQRYPLKTIAGFDTFFANSKVRCGELTPDGYKQMRELGSSTGGTIIRALYSDNRRCSESLNEFLAGASARISSESFGDRNYGSFSDLLKDTDIHQDIIDAFAKYIRDRDSFERFVNELEPANANACPLIRDLVGSAIIDAFAVFEDMGIQDMNSTVRDLNFDCAVAMAAGMKRTYVKQLRDIVVQTTKGPDSTPSEITIPSQSGIEAEKFPDPKQLNMTTVLMASDIHLLVLLDTLVPEWPKVRPAFGDILRIKPLVTGVSVTFQNMTELIPWKQFNTYITTHLV